MGTKNDPGKFDCYSRAEPDEPMFILLGRDPIGAMLVGLWVDVAERLGKDPEKIAEARNCAYDMQRYAETQHEMQDLNTTAAAFLEAAYRVWLETHADRGES